MINEKELIKRNLKIPLPSTRTIRDLPDGITAIPVYKKSYVLLDKVIEINSTTLQLQRVIELDKEYPKAIIGFHPPLFKDFINKDNTINTHVNVGETVVLGLKFKNDKNPPRIVKELYFTSLNSITVIIAKLDNEDYYPSYFLEKYIEPDAS